MFVITFYSVPTIESVSGRSGEILLCKLEQDKDLFCKDRHRNTVSEFSTVVLVLYYYRLGHSSEGEEAP